MNFEVNLIFLIIVRRNNIVSCDHVLIKPFFLAKLRDKNLNILRTKRAFKMK